MAPTAVKNNKINGVGDARNNNKLTLPVFPAFPCSIAGMLLPRAVLKYELLRASQSEKSSAIGEFCRTSAQQEHIGPVCFKGLLHGSKETNR